MYATRNIVYVLCTTWKVIHKNYLDILYNRHGSHSRFQVCVCVYTCIHTYIHTYMLTYVRMWHLQQNLETVFQGC